MRKLIVAQIIAGILILLLQGGLTLFTIDTIVGTSYFSIGNSALLGLLFLTLRLGKIND